MFQAIPEFPVVLPDPSAPLIPKQKILIKGKAEVVLSSLQAFESSEKKSVYGAFTNSKQSANYTCSSSQKTAKCYF